MKKIMALTAAMAVAFVSLAADMASQPWVKMKLNELHTNILDEVQYIVPTGGVTKVYVDEKVNEAAEQTLAAAKDYTDENKGVSAEYVSSAITNSVSPNPLVTNGVRIATIGGKDIYAPEGGAATGGVTKLYVDTAIRDSVNPAAVMDGVKIATLAGKDIYAPSGTVSKAYVDGAISNAVAETQVWVREYVETNVTAQLQLFKPFSATCINPETGEDILFGLNFIQANYDALMVTNSTVNGMADGTLFAKVGENAYRNTSNVSCEDIVGGVEKWGYDLSDGHYEYITNGTSVEIKAVYSTTNDNYMVRLVAVVGSTEFKSFETSNGVNVFGVGENFEQTFTLVACKITKAQMEALTTPKVSFRWLDLFVGNAYAVTDVRLEPEVEKIGDKIRYHNFGKVITDSEDVVKFGIDSIKWGDGEYDLSEYDFALNYEVKANEEVKGVYQKAKDLYGDGSKDYKNELIEDLYNEIKSALKEEVGAAKAQQIYNAKIKGTGENALKTAIGDAIEDFFSYYNDSPSFNSIKEWNDWLEHISEYTGGMLEPGYENGENPYGYYVDVEEEGETPNNKPVPPSNHKHSNPYGTCGNFKCGVCKQKYTPAGLPTQHNFTSERSGECAKCSNMVPKRPGAQKEKCGMNGTSDSHHDGWHDKKLPGDKGGEASTMVCTCQCGAKEYGHISRTTHKWENDGVDCFEIMGCGREWKDGKTEHSHTGFTWEEKRNHIWRMPSFFGNVNEWKQPTAEQDQDKCYITRVCSHGKDEEGANLGCKLVDENYGEPHVFKAPEDFGKEAQWRMGNPQNGENPKMHGHRKVCAKNAWRTIGSLWNDGCGKEVWEDWSLHNKVNNSTYLNATDHKTTATCDKKEQGCNFSESTTNRHNYATLFWEYLDNSSHRKVETCQDRGSTNPGCHHTNRLAAVSHDTGPVQETTYYDNYDHILSYWCNTCTNAYFDFEEHSVWSLPDVNWEHHWFVTNYVYNVYHELWGTSSCVSSGHGASSTCEGCKEDIIDPFVRQCDYNWSFDDGPYAGIDVGTCKYCNHQVQNPCHVISVEKPGGKTYEGTRPFNDKYHACFHNVSEALTSPAHRFGEHLTDGFWRDGEFIEDGCSVCGFVPAPKPSYDGTLEPKMPVLNPNTWNSFLGSKKLIGSPKLWNPPIMKLDGDEPVYEIGENALTNFFMDCVALQEVKFNFVTNVHYRGLSGAFAGCTNLTSVGFRDLETVMAYAFDGAFAGCTSLGKTLPSGIEIENLTEVEEYAFRNAFAGCTSLGCFSLGDTASIATRGSMFEGAFSGCTSLVAVNLSALHGGGYATFKNAFKDCTSLEVAIIQNVEGYGGSFMFQNAFYNCRNLTLVELGSFSTVYAYAFQNAFHGCTSLERLDFHGSFDLVEEGVFEGMFTGCTNLTYVSFETTKARVRGLPDYPFGIPSGNNCVIHCTDGDITIP